MTSNEQSTADAQARATKASESFAEMRHAVAKVDALIAAAQDLYGSTEWGPEADARRMEQIGQLLGASCEAAEDAILAVDRFNSEHCDSALLEGGAK